MNRLLPAAACVLSLLAVRVGACEMKVSFDDVRNEDRVRLTWDVPPLYADRNQSYDVFERRLDGVWEDTRWRYVGQGHSDPGKKGEITFMPGSSEAEAFEFLVVVSGNRETDSGCTGRIIGTVTPNSRLAAVSHRKIVPIAGSVRGAYGSDFRTSLTLHHVARTKGKVYFRPVGTLPSASDPFVTYEFGERGEAPVSIHFDDVLDTMGASGLGSLEIVPDPGTRLAVPVIEARVYNVTPDGTFGSRVPAVWAAEWVRYREAEPNIELRIPPVQPDFRRNVGFRSLTKVDYIVYVLHANGESHRLFRHAPANYTWFGTLDDLAGMHIPNDSLVTITFSDGVAVGFRTETENFTNDPTVVIGDPSEMTRELSWR